MGRRDRKTGPNSVVSTAVANPSGLSGTHGLWKRLYLGGASASTTGTTDGSNNFGINTGIDSTDPDTSSGGADYPQYSVIKVVGDPVTERTDLKMAIRFSWPVTDIFGRPVTKMSSPYCHLFLVDLPLSQSATGGMQDPWKADGNPIGTDGSPIAVNDLNISFGLSERPANDDYTTGVTSDLFPATGVGVYESAGDWRMYPCQSDTTQATAHANIKPSASGAGSNVRIRGWHGCINTSNDRLAGGHAVGHKTTADDDQTLVYGKSLAWNLHQTNAQGDISSDNDIYWTLWINRTGANTAAHTVAFNIKVMSIPLSVNGKTECSFDDLFPVEYVAGAGGADGA